MSGIVSKFLLTGDTFMPELHLRHPVFTHSSCGPFTKRCERIKKFKENCYLNYVYKNELNPVELNFSPFMISLGKRNRNCNVVDDFSTKTCVPSKTKTNINIFNLITRINEEVKTLVKYISCDFKCKFNKTYNLNQK